MTERLLTQQVAILVSVGSAALSLADTLVLVVLVVLITSPCHKTVQLTEHLDMAGTVDVNVTWTVCSPDALSAITGSENTDSGEVSMIFW